MILLRKSINAVLSTSFQISHTFVLFWMRRPYNPLLVRLKIEIVSTKILEPESFFLRLSSIKMSVLVICLKKKFEINFEIKLNISKMV